MLVTPGFILAKYWVVCNNYCKNRESSCVKKLLKNGFENIPGGTYTLTLKWGNVVCKKRISVPDEIHVDFMITFWPCAARRVFYFLYRERRESDVQEGAFAGQRSVYNLNFCNRLWDSSLQNSSASLLTYVLGVSNNPFAGLNNIINEFPVASLRHRLCSFLCSPLCRESFVHNLYHPTFEFYHGSWSDITEHTWLFLICSRTVYKLFQVATVVERGVPMMFTTSMQ